MSITGLGEIFDLGGKIIDKIFPDKQAADTAKLKLLEMQQNGELAMLTAYKEQDIAQANINAVEAGNSSVFVAGWRPAIGWICAASLAYIFLVMPAANQILKIVRPDLILPAISTSGTMELVFAMLGMGGLRSYEKIRGVAR